ncbi:MAG: DUF59 domain-containing protein [Bacteroidetes bacterium]|nr:DUF59 domain-containing protein [Bacteroidota bacterium]
MEESKQKPLEKKIITALRTVFDPEIPVNVYDLGLIYEINIDDSSNVQIVMTLTNPNCPVADQLIVDVRDIVKTVGGVDKVEVKLVFEPVWTKDNMSDAALLDLGLL